MVENDCADRSQSQRDVRPVYVTSYSREMPDRDHREVDRARRLQRERLKVDAGCCLCFWSAEHSKGNTRTSVRYKTVVNGREGCYA